MQGFNDDLSAILGVLYPACQPGLFKAINDTGERAGSETHDSGDPTHIGHGLVIDHRPCALTYDGGRISAFGGGLMLTIKEARAMVNPMPPGAPSVHRRLNWARCYTDNMSAAPPALLRFEKLIGTWRVVGRTTDAHHDDVTGWNTFEWLLDGFFLKSRGEITVNNAIVRSEEFIRYDETTDSFPSHCYTNMSSEVLMYQWDAHGSTVLHWTESARYLGTFSPDWETLTGGWRPAPGQPAPSGASFDAVMTRVAP